jgi:hypothetical protein
MLGLAAIQSQANTFFTSSIGDLKMRAEAQTLIDEIQEVVALLRRHL